MLRISRLLTTVVSLTILTGVALADPIQGGTTTVPILAEQDIVLFSNTPINPGAEISVPGFSGNCSFEFTRQTQVGSEIDIQLTAGARCVGFLPGLGDYVFGAVGPFQPSDYSSTISNVVQDPNDPGFSSGDPSSFLSGDFQISGAAFGLEILSGPLTGVVLVTDPNQSFGFQSVWDGLPPSPGTVFSNNGDEVLNVLFNGEVVGTSSNRTLTVVPEPSSGLMVTMMAAICLWRLRGRKQRP